ncbi:sigma-70 family RNA polymerase sigma factor [Luteipulveratus mongoliensis]|uniref:RNA polymerase sigma factor n=1 Tax=Luteipulveratus mongoliensis TaxID=571913 RepID=A0A0K1JFU2_9MICO|nr:sigma-70 family RNA polymerase sigma factor [Luteipulveratus mongoliensis]AKU15574.1 RNA polymerase factor sigma-70 [Luteipulveratus mongoliensis]
MADVTDLQARIDGYRPELLAHCYRMLGSIHDAEDLVQETMLRAWRAADRYDEQRASLRTWLYRIATNACLTELERRGRRELPSGIAGPSPELVEFPEMHAEVPWLEPIPDRLLGTAADDPATVVAARNGIRLAFVAALQHLPAKQRAVLVLRDVLAWSAAEVADLLELSPAAVNSALQRARATIDKADLVSDDLPERLDTGQQALIERYVTTFRDSDMDGLSRILHEDVVLEMPPALVWFAGRTRTLEFFGLKVGPDADFWRAVPVGANGQPAVAYYRRHDDGQHHAHAVHVLTTSDDLVSRITVFVDASLFARFGLPPTYERKD